MEKTPSGGGRDTFLSIMLVLVLGGAFFMFLNFVSFGLFSYVLLAVLGMTFVGFLHYVLWGQALSQEIADEREEQRLREELDVIDAEVDDDT